MQCLSPPRRIHRGNTRGTGNDGNIMREDSITRFDNLNEADESELANWIDRHSWMADSVKRRGRYVAIRNYLCAERGYTAKQVEEMNLRQSLEAIRTGSP